MLYCICVSGNLGRILLLHLLDNSINVSAVFTDSHSEDIIKVCETHKIKYFKGNPRNGNAIEWIEENNVSFNHILSINYLFILDDKLIDLANGYAINFHGSLLPKYRGRTPHVWSIINGEKETGITAHLMNSECDDGDIVKQIVVPIDDDDTGAIVLNKFNILYPSLVDRVISDIEDNTIKCKMQDKTLATYYGKRTSLDGLINWDWQKERIRNWVRAQAFPYPGAFSFINGCKVIINRISYSSYGYEDAMSNGLVLSINNEHPIIKTQNGAICLEEFETTVILNVNDQFQ